jgi:hypothetical protein
MIMDRERQNRGIVGGEGRTATETFLSDRIAAERSKGGDSGTIKALEELSKKILATGDAFDVLRRQQEEAIQSGAGVDVLAKNAKEMNNLIAEKSAGLGQFGGGAPPPSATSQMAQLFSRELMINLSKDLAGALLKTPLEGMHTRATIGQVTTDQFRAATELSQRDIVVGLNAAYNREAGLASTAAASAGVTDKVSRSLGFGTADQAAGQMGGMAGAKRGGRAALGLSLGTTLVEEVGQNQWQARRAAAFAQYKQYGEQAEGAHIMALEMAEEQSRGRRAYMESMGITGLTGEQGVAGDTNAFVSETGYDEVTRMGVLGNLGVFGGRGNGARMNAMSTAAGRLGRAVGRDPGEIAGQMSGMAGVATTDEGARQSFIDMYARAMAQGFDTSELNKMATTAVVSMSAKVGGVAGPSGSDTMSLLLQNANTAFGKESKAGAINAAQSFAERMNTQMTSSGGFQQYLNAGNAAKSLSAMGESDPQGNLQAYIGNMNAAELTSPRVVAELRKMGFRGDPAELQRLQLKNWGSAQLGILKGLGAGSAAVAQQVLESGAGAVSNTMTVQQLELVAGGGRLQGTEAGLAETARREAGSLLQGATRLDRVRAQQRQRATQGAAGATAELYSEGPELEANAPDILKNVMRGFSDGVGKLGSVSKDSSIAVKALGDAAFVAAGKIGMIGVAAGVRDTTPLPPMKVEPK